jgi:DNA-binding response OmpR family regulator
VFPAEKEQNAQTLPLRVLVVDDDPDTVSTLSALLRSENYEVRGHRTGQAAVDSLRGGFKPDVVISDIAMPKINGWTLAKEVRRRMGSRPLLIAITGHYTKSADKVLSHISGFDHYLTKPADPAVLLTLVAGVKPAG